MADKLPLIVAAANEVEEELARLEKSTAAMEKQELRSKKHIERAGKLLTEFADAEDGLSAKVRALNDAITGAQHRHVAAAERVHKYAMTVAERTSTYQGLALRQAEVGKNAAAMTAALQPALETANEQARLEALNHAAEQLDLLVATLNALVEDTKQADFFDLTKDIDAVRQAVISARNKLRGGAPVQH